MKKSIKLVWFVLVVSLISLSCKNNNSNTNKTAINSSASQTTQQVTGKITVLTPAEFREKSKNNTIIDVRTPFEYSQGYIKGSKNINFFDKDFMNKIASYNKNKPIYVYCKSGHRSGIAVKKMVELGFKNVYELKGGIINWVRSNNEIEK